MLLIALCFLVSCSPELTWRDIQHIVAWTSKRQFIKKEAGIKWTKNGAGLWFNRIVGFGLMDADAMVKMADPKKWQRVPEKNMCVINSDDLNDLKLPM